MFKKCIGEKNIKLRVKVNTWEEAIKEAGKVLEKNGYVSEDYTNAMVESAHKLGPYIVVAPGLALPHARPENGANKTGFSLITLQKPVKFGHSDNDPVKVVIAMACADSVSHIEMLKVIANIFAERCVVDKIAQAENKMRILTLLEDYYADMV